MGRQDEDRLSGHFYYKNLLTTKVCRQRIYTIFILMVNLKKLNPTLDSKRHNRIKLLLSEADFTHS